MPMMADPPSIVMVIPSGSLEANTKFTVGLRPGLAPDSVTASTQPGPFSTSLQPDGPRRYKGTVSWKGESDATERNGNIVVAAGADSLTIPVRVIYKAAKNTVHPPGTPGPPDAAPSAGAAAAQAAPGKTADAHSAGAPPTP
jgi:hypothetical protein